MLGLSLAFALLVGTLVGLLIQQWMRAKEWRALLRQGQRDVNQAHDKEITATLRYIRATALRQAARDYDSVESATKRKNLSWRAPASATGDSTSVVALWLIDQAERIENEA